MWTENMGLLNGVFGDRLKHPLCLLLGEKHIQQDGGRAVPRAESVLWVPAEHNPEGGPTANRHLGELELSEFATSSLH